MNRHGLEYPLPPLIPGGIICRGRRFPNAALEFICCCALFTIHHPYQLRELFTNTLDSSCLRINWDPWDIDDVSHAKPSEIRACFWQMYEFNHPIYTKWSQRNVAEHRIELERILQPMAAAYGSRPTASWYRDDIKHCRRNGITSPCWTEGCFYNEDGFGLRAPRTP